MEPERQGMQMLKDLARNLAHGVLRHFGKDQLTQLRKQRR